MLRTLYLLRAEVRRTFTLMFRYWMNGFSFAVTVYLFFLILVFMGGAMGGHEISNGMKAATLVRMLMWQLSLGSISVLGWSFFNEAATGTLEHLYLSPRGVTRIFLSRSVADFLSMLLVMTTSAALAMLTTGVRLYLPPLELAVILPLGVAGSYGFGFLLAAMTLTFKRTQQVMNLFQFFFLFLSGAVVPLEQMHWALRYLGYSLPMTWGIQALHRVTIDGAQLGAVTDLLVRMLSTSALWLIIGIAVYTVADRRARLQGSIGQY